MNTPVSVESVRLFANVPTCTFERCSRGPSGVSPGQNHLAVSQPNIAAVSLGEPEGKDTATPFGVSRSFDVVLDHNGYDIVAEPAHGQCIEQDLEKIELDRQRIGRRREVGGILAAPQGHLL